MLLPAEDELPADGVIEFPEGLPGLPDQRRFVLLQPEGLEPLVVLASLDDQRVSLAAVQARAVWEEYRVALDDDDWETLGSTADDHARLLCLAVVILASSGAAATCNLFAPIVIDPETRRGKQVVQLGSDYPMLHPLGGVGSGGGPEEDARDAGAA